MKNSGRRLRTHPLRARTGPRTVRQSRLRVQQVAVSARTPCGGAGATTVLSPVARRRTFGWLSLIPSLAHEGGAAVGGEPCRVCGEAIAATAHLVQKTRHVCSSRCNNTLKRRTKRSQEMLRDDPRKPVRPAAATSVLAPEDTLGRFCRRGSRRRNCGRCARPPPTVRIPARSGTGSTRSTVPAVGSCPGSGTRRRSVSPV